MSRHIDRDVLVIGAGHAGPAMSHLLTRADRDDVVLERRDRLGGGRLDRWDEFTLATSPRGSRRPRAARPPLAKLPGLGAH